MCESEEKRYMDRLSQILISKFSGIENCQLKDIVEFIVKEEGNSFHIGFFFLYDRVKKSFLLSEFFPKGDYTEEEKKVKAGLEEKKYDIDTDKPFESSCGLFYYVARNFINNSENEKNYLAINQIDKFKREETELAQYNIDFIELHNKVKSQYIFPVYIASEKLYEGKRDKILHAVIVLVSFSDKNKIKRHDLKLLSELISFIISVEARNIANKALHTFINTLSDVGRVKYSRTEYGKIINSLKQFYVDNEENNTLKHCLLKHASIWTLNGGESKNIFLVKEKNFNYNKGNMDITNIITNRIISNPGSPHYFYDFITDRIEKIKEKFEKNEEVPFQDLIEIRKFEEIGDRFYDKKKFQESSAIENDDIVVLFPILPHLGKEEDESKSKKGKNKKDFNIIGLMVFYFAQNTCAYYYDSNFLELIAHKIYENMQIVISRTRREVRRSIFEELSYMLEDDKKFFEASASVIKKTMDFEHCLIYLFNDDRTKFVLKTEVDGSNFPKEIEINIENSYGCFFDVLKDRQESTSSQNYFQILQTNPSSKMPLMWYSQTAIEDPEFQNNAPTIYSALLIPIQVPKNDIRGVLISLNNKRRIDMEGQSERSFFSLKDYEIASIGAESIAIYVEIFQSAGRYKQLLRKLAHEIPGQMSFIKQSNTQVKEEFETILERVQRIPSSDISKTIDEYQKRLIFNLLRQESQAARRVQLYAEYPRLEKLDPKHIRRELEILNMNLFLSSTIEDFRLTAEKQGVFVQFDFVHELHHQTKYTLEVHPLFELAVWNLINNAIQYAYFGTTILIKCEFGLQNNLIHVENIGISIPEDMKKKIFDEGVRSEAAKERYFKGTGLGLTMARQVVKVHKGGDILMENKNDICQRNIFGISELKRLLENFSSDAERERFINKKLPLPYKKTYTNFKKQLEFTEQEKEILNKYKKFLISNSNWADKNLIKNCLEDRFDGNENINHLFKKEINVPVSFIKFSIKMAVNI
ncbi:MAG TPA: HAMP domain-containing sensor histidine kinase [Candidatus Deferrimicrobium sp.]|nr:HAMP domain-containing sensor histidine kinase [Candidatus Deferrimicrobium sp.]